MGVLDEAIADTVDTAKEGAALRPDRWLAPRSRSRTDAPDGDRMTVEVLEFRREDWRHAAKTLRKIADDLNAGEYPECAVGALTIIGAREG